MGLGGYGVQGGDYGGVQIAKQRKHVTAVRSAIDAELVLQANQVDFIDVQKIGRLPVGDKIVLPQFERTRGG